MEKRALLISVLACLAGLQSLAAEIVHDAARDLAVNTASRAVFTNQWGGVWSFMHASTYAGTRALLAGNRANYTSDVTDVDGDAWVYERGPAKDSSSSPRFTINPSARTDGYASMRGEAYPAIRPGELSVHPGPVNVPSAADYRCAVLRFTVPRTGTYAVEARVWNRNTGWIAAALFANGVEVVSRQAWQSAASAVKTNDFSRAATSYAAGDTLELSFDGNGTYNCNAAGFVFRVVESRSDDDVIDANLIYAANKGVGTASNPFTTSAGTWSAFSGTNMVRAALSSGYLRSSQGAGLVGTSNSGSVPYIAVNTNDVPVTEYSNGKPSVCQGRALWPQEIYVHPGNPEHAYLRLKPREGGLFDIGFTARDFTKMTNQKNTDGTFAVATPGDGVTVRILQGGRVLASRFVSLEWSPSSGSAFVRGVAVVPDMPLELEVDPGATHTGDATGIFWGLVRTGDLPTTYSANAAFKANMTSSTPAAHFVHNGATWSVGKHQGGWAGDYSVYTVRQASRFNGNCSGFGITAGTSPYMLVNMTGRQLTAAEMGSGTAGPGIDALVAHPAGDFSATTIRFTVPTSGIWRATMWIEDLDASGTAADNAGVKGLILTNGLAATEAQACAETDRMIAAGANPYAYVQIGETYFRKGTTIDFAIDNQGLHNFDLTEIYAGLVLVEADQERGTLILVR